MKRATTKSRRAGIILPLLLFIMSAGGLKAQPTVYVTTMDYDGNGVADQLWYGTNAYVYIKHGGTGVWTYYYMGPTFSFFNGGSQLDGVAGAEVALWHPISESVVVITDRTKTTKSYYLGSTGINAWVQCTNSFTNLDGQPGNEMMFNYYNRSAASKKGYMIIHRTKSTRSTWTCFNLASRQSNPGDEADTDVLEGSQEIPGGTFDENTATPEEVIRFKTTSYFDKPAAVNNITLSPNPTNGIVNIQTDKPGEVIKQVVITDAQGKVMFTSSSNSRRIDISHLLNGLYFCKVQTNEKVYAGKILKQ